MITALRYLPIAAIIAAVASFTAMDSSIFLDVDIQWIEMIASMLILYVFFWLRAYTWHKYLRSTGYTIGFSQACASLFVTVLTKYVPGKVWPLLSAAAYVTSPETRFRDSLASVGWYQLAIVVSGIGIGSIGLLAIANQPVGMYAIPIVILLILSIIVDRRLYVTQVVEKLAARIGVTISHGQWSNTSLACHCMLHWLVMAGAYWLLFRSVGLRIDPAVVLSQAMANVVGILVPVAPAGLGVREAAGAGYLAAHTLDAGAALLYATLARIWSFVVELAVFGTGLALHRANTQYG